MISRYWRMSEDMPNIDAPMTRSIEYLRTEAKYSEKPWCGSSPRYCTFTATVMSSMRRTRSSAR